MAIAYDIHPFEQRGLGLAPFRCVGMYEKVYVACHGAPAQPAGTCDYCGNGIRYVFEIKSADGKCFGVGCECVRKTDREAPVEDFDKIKAAHDRKIRQEKTKARNDKTDARINAAFALLDSDSKIQDAFKAKPHPFKNHADNGKTFLDYVNYLRNYAGRSGRLAVAKIIESAN